MTVKYCLSLENWVAGRRGSRPETNPRKKAQIYIRNQTRRREEVRDYFHRFDYRPLVDDIGLPGVNFGRAMLQGELLGARVDPDTDVALSHPWQDMTDAEQVRALKIPDLRKCPSYPAKLAQYRELSAEYDGRLPGRKVGFVSGQYGKAIAAPMNVVFDLVGEEAFVRMYTDPDLVHAYFEKVMEVFALAWQVKQEVEGCEYTSSYLGDCTNTMLSPHAFAEFALPCNRAFGQRFPNLESHNCGVVTHLLPLIADYGPFRWVELGWGTALEGARECFGDAMLLPRLGVEFMQHYSPDQAYDKTTEMLRLLAGDGPVALHSNCISPEKTTPEVLEALFTAVADFESGQPPRT